MNAKKRVMIIGLDCATPELVFGSWLEALPHIKQVLDAGVYGPLRSSVPPITCPAWMVAMTGQNPGRLGFYGFRNRLDYSYHRMGIANGTSVRVKTVWDYLTENGKSSILLGVPQTYPPRPINGCMVTDFLAPNINCQYTYPNQLKEEIKNLVGEYLLDVKEFRTEDKEGLLKQIYEMTEKRFKVAKYLIGKNPEWDFFMMVEIGVDRIHHSFWKYMDIKHPAYIPGNPYETAIFDYYCYIDQQIGELLKAAEVGEETLTILMSDHGAKAMLGGIAINQWLMQEGYLMLKNPPTGLQQIKPEDIDWSRTKVWASGGYYSRLNFNIVGREPEGAVQPEELEVFTADLIDKIEMMTDSCGNLLGNRAYRPTDVYDQVNNIPPDLIVYLGNLDYRAVGSVGHTSIYVTENDTGPDDANHAEDGIFVMKGKGQMRERTGLQLLDIAPTVLDYFGIEVPTEMVGKIIE